MTEQLPLLIWLAGIAQFGVIIASFSVPLVMDWRRLLEPLPKLMRQLIWVYGGYVLATIISLGAVSVILSEELATGELLARCICGYAGLFWGVRLLLQFVVYFDSKEFRTTWWLNAGYHGLTVVFAFVTTVFVLATLR